MTALVSENKSIYLFNVDSYTYIKYLCSDIRHMVSL